MKHITVLGAGPSGISTGAYLAEKGYAITVLEKNKQVGGMAGSFVYQGHVLDFGPHKLYSQIPGIMEEFKNILGDVDTLKVPKKNSLYLLGKHFDFPVKIFQIITGISPVKSAQLGFGFMWSTAKNIVAPKQQHTYEDYFVAGFGHPAYNLLFKGFAEKLWGPPQTLSEELGRKRVPVPNVVELLLSKDKDSKGREISAKYFYYPKSGGISVISENFKKRIIKKKGKVETGVTIEKIHLKNKKVEAVSYKKNGKLVKKKTDMVSSTIYLLDLLQMITPKPPLSVLAAATNLKYRSLVLVYVFVNKKRALKDNWVFFPEKKYVFNRVSEHNSFNPSLVKKGTSVLTAEITCELGGAFYDSDDEYFYRRVIEDLEATNLVKEQDVTGFLVKKARRVYPVYDVHYRKNLDVVLQYLAQIPNLFTVGRQGLYNYNNIDHCIDMSRHATEYVDAYFDGASAQELETLWAKKRKYFDAYRIVD